jgi:uncharacterized protein YndB with AHSA1/START domain
MNDIHKEITMVRVFDAPRELVFKAWTDESLVTQWWGPNGVFTPVCEVDAREGGAIHIVLEAGETLGDYKGTQWPMKGMFTEVTPPAKLVFTNTAMHEDKPFLELINEITFEEIDGKTKMTVHITAVKAVAEAEHAIGGMEQGWNEQLDKLVIFVSTMK